MVVDSLSKGFLAGSRVALFAMASRRSAHWNVLDSKTKTWHDIAVRYDGTASLLPVARILGPCAMSINNPYAKTKKRPAPAPTPLTIPTSDNAAALVIAAADKAGMDGIDRARIDAIILRESGNSLFIQQQRRRDAKVNEKIAALQEKVRQNPQWHTPSMDREIESAMAEALAQRPTRSTSVVVDMDMFYMACELLRYPHLKDRPACVGSGMILTSNYCARQYGVRSAMAGWIGDKLVEELSEGKEKLTHVPSDFALYREKSVIVRGVLAEFDPSLRAYSLDEAYLDLAPYLAYRLTKGWGHDRIKEALVNDRASKDEDETETAAETDHDNENDDCVSQSHEVLNQFRASICLEEAGRIIDDMRERVCIATGGLTCSAGLAPNFMLAKIASDRNKPNGSCLVPSDHECVLAFLHPLPTRKVSGIGRVTDKILNAFAIHTVRDLYDQRALIQYLFQTASAGFLLRASIGCSSSRSTEGDEAEQAQKGISRERTFQSGRPWSEINARLEDIARKLSSDMVPKDLHGRTITVKVKLHTFDCLSKARTMTVGVLLQAPEDLVREAAELLREIRAEFKGQQFSVRLLGVRCSNFAKPSPVETIDRFLTETEPLRSRSTSPVPKAKVQGPLQVNIDRFLHDKDKIVAKPRRVSTSPGTGGSESATNAPICPICGQTLLAANNATLNRHIDACLNGDKKPPSKRPKPSSLDSFFTSHNR